MSAIHIKKADSSLKQKSKSFFYYKRGVCFFVFSRFIHLVVVSL